MFKLILKDLKLSKKVMGIIIIYILIISFSILSLIDELFASITYIILMVMGIFMLVIFTNGHDTRNKTEVVINSFPINRSDIVKGKYMTLVLFIIIICSVLFLSSNILRILFSNFQSGKRVTMENVIVATNITLLFYSIYYPIYFKVGEDMRTFNYILWFLVIVSPSLVKELVEWLIKKDMLDEILSIDINKINISILIVLIIIFYISLQISKKIYKQREF